MNEKYYVIIGRFQPLHIGHLKLIRKALDKNKNVLVFLRDTGKNKKNPYTIEQRKRMFYKEFSHEIITNRIKLVAIKGVDIGGVYYGREVGYEIKQLHLDKETEAISATKIREEQND